jgi:hypothetical protein
VSGAHRLKIIIIIWPKCAVRRGRRKVRSSRTHLEPCSLFFAISTICRGAGKINRQTSQTLYIVRTRQVGNFVPPYKTQRVKSFLQMQLPRFHYTEIYYSCLFSVFRPGKWVFLYMILRRVSLSISAPLSLSLFTLAQ